MRRLGSGRFERNLSNDGHSALLTICIDNQEYVSFLEVGCCFSDDETAPLRLGLLGESDPDVRKPKTKGGFLIFGGCQNLWI